VGLGVFVREKAEHLERDLAVFTLLFSYCHRPVLQVAIW
jgi:hypothetical protein